MPKIEFVGASRENQSNPAANPARLINCYRELTGTADPAFILKSVLGMQLFASISSVFIRAMATVDGVLYVACGGDLYSVSSAGVATLLGAIEDGETTIAGNNGNVTIAANGKYFVWDGASVTQPATGAITNIGSVVFIGQYTVLTELAGSRRFQWSAVADAKTFDALDFATKEGRDGDIIQVEVVNGKLWLFGENSVEIWYDSGAGFIRTAGGIIDVGLKDFGLVANFPNGAFYIGNDDTVYITQGGGAQPVSTIPVEVSLKENTSKSCFYYEDNGHRICVIAFDDRPAWCFDLATGEWHERAEGVSDDPWRAADSVRAYGKWLVGYNDGNIYDLGRTNEDAAQPLLRTMVSSDFDFDGSRRRIKELEIYARMGESDLGRSAKIMMRVSRDGGRTWSDYREKSLGDLGDYTQRALFRSMGQFRRICIELTISEPAEIPIYGAVRVEAA